MTEFTYRYNALDNKLQTSVIASGVIALKILHKEYTVAQTKQGRKTLKERVNSERPQRGSSITEENNYRVLTEVEKYVDTPSLIGKQLAKDINRVGFDLSSQTLKKGDIVASEKAASDFLEGLSIDQRLLLDQSQGLSAPVSQFLAKHLKLPNSRLLNTNVLSIGQTIFSKVENTVSIIRKENYYSFNDQQMQVAEKGRFYYKPVGRPIQSGLIEEDAVLYIALQKAMVARQKDPKGSIVITYVDKNREKIEFEIEPILSVSENIQMGPKIDSLTWTSDITTYDASVKLDSLFESKNVWNKRQDWLSRHALPLRIIAGTLLALGVAVGLGLIGGLAIGLGIGAIVLFVRGSMMLYDKMLDFNQPQFLSENKVSSDRRLSPPSPTVFPALSSSEVSPKNQGVFHRLPSRFQNLKDRGEKVSEPSHKKHPFSIL